MKYGYHGAEFEDIHGESAEYPGIDSPQKLYDALTAVWCYDTCSPGRQSFWTKENMTDGQCGITALLVQDIFGGEIYGILLPGGAVHSYNVVNGHIIDLTSEQFGGNVGKLEYNKSPQLYREKQLSDPVRRGRYELLCSLLREKLAQ